MGKANDNDGALREVLQKPDPQRASETLMSAFDPKGDLRIATEDKEMSVRTGQ